jgi:cytochrome c-type biogenesis protein CcmF
MLAEFGFGILILTLILSLFAAGAAVYGYYGRSDRWVESARRAQQLTFPLTTLAVLALVYLLVTGHYEVKYVYSVTDVTMPLYLKITALWGGQPGSLLFWSWLLAVFATAVTFRNWERDREFLPWVIVVTSVTLAFFLALIIFFENPFVRWWQSMNGDIVAKMFTPPGGSLKIPNNGEGLSPLLRHPGMIIHPPMLYLGFVSFVIPYAFAIAALVTGRTDDRWIRLTRQWTLVAWLFLSLGLVLGMRWAYDVLGWGGYWGWDPVEIAALMPWLTGTPFLHSVMIEERRGILKPWNIFLIILTYSLVITGTFLTRSGILSSVHAFAESAIGPIFLIYIGVTLIISTALLIHRWKDLRAILPMKSMLSREALFLLNNLLFMGVLIVCLWGVLFPVISEIVTGVKVTVGPPFYERAVGPLFGALIALMGIAPLSAWGKSTLRTLGKAMWKPAIPTALIPILLFSLGVRNWIALVGFTLIAFVLFITLHEYWRGVRARITAHGEGFFTAIVRLATNNRRRYGGYIIHIAMVIMAIGILGIEVFQTTTQKSLGIGDSLEISGYTVRFDDLAQFQYIDGRIVTRATLGIFKDGKFLQEIHPRYDIYPSGQSMTIAGVRTTLVDDLYVVLVNWEGISSARAPFKVYHNPLINWLWIGSLIFVFGYVIVAWPQKEPE